MAKALYNLLLLLLLIIFIFFPLSSSAQNTGNITVGTSITATENSNPWRSPSGDFAFGFQRLQDNNNLFLLSIWFDRIPDRTIVWYPRGTNPVPRGSTVQLNSRDGLVLRDPQSRLIYNTNNLADEVAYGFLNNTGNLVLSRSDSTSLWQSFNNPSDTILPTQTIEINRDLVSRISETNFSEGRFWARMLSDGNFVFNTKSVPSNSDFDDEYYTSRTSDVNASNSGFQVVFNERASISVRKRNGDQLILTPRSVPPVSDFYHRATLNFDGLFTQYYHPRNSGSSPGWTAARSWPDNICFNINGDRGSGACGYNSVCRIENQRPICQCPQGFSLADPNNAYGDCIPNFVQSCVGNETGSSPEEVYGLLNISDTDWPGNDYEQINRSTIENCRSACLNDCFCAAAIYRSDSCWKKKLPLSNGRVDTTLGSTAFLKFRRSDIPILTPDQHPHNNPRRDQKTLIVIISVLLGSSVFINLLFISAACLGFFLIYKKRIPVLNQTHDASGSNLRCFTYKELVHATDGFKEELGRGAFGIVYKGLMPNGSETVFAVKKLDRVAEDSEKEFKTEVNVIGQTHHKNLVRLLGFCNEGTNRLLVYEYMCNGTLASFLFGSPKPSWNQRTEIALGVAQGLTYLHEECSTQIIHCDIKPQNILLDEYYNARISDFGLAKLLMINQSQTMTNIRGTKGYVAPEWFRNKQINVKVDVYSFGVLLLEIIACRKSLEDLESGNAENAILTDWVWDCFQDGRLDSLVENDLEALSDGKKLERFVMVGIWCIQEDASLRPSMRRACQMLEGIVQVAVPPCPSPFS
ncbi:hypothetical protein BUALT_Bualt02G0190900 [Buddleja alternifolia]|uniref:Receptor-like serine/threonine-protein kinase n=1 Tax=Buddleja alternifolia TaxID=168488 RepID=A0AAV6Y2P4_9LAMI|nr:hypothetical protein BUALT_Bualt02G0190900 [Buddleja alternifolia]